MSRIQKKNINPKTAFFILSTVFFIFVALSIPVFAQILASEGIQTSILFTRQFFIWGFFGLLAGIGFAFIGIKSLSVSALVRSIRFLLMLLIVLTFLMYIALKVPIN